MFEVDGYVDQIIRCLFPAGEVTRVKITCSCLTAFTGAIPKALVDTDAVPILSCPHCSKEFVYYQGYISRLSNFKTINGVPIPSDLQDFKTWTKET